MSDADLIHKSSMHRLPQWLAAAGRSPLTSARLAHASPEPAPGIWSAQSQRLAEVAGDGWAAAGDAASCFDPLSSVGILKALRTGKLASFVAMDALRGRDSRALYQTIVTREYDDYRATKAWFYNQEQRWPESPFWQRRHAVQPVTA